jgi:sulfoxide reductase heme-binding subunit YedZ
MPAWTCAATIDVKADLRARIRSVGEPRFFRAFLVVACSLPAAYAIAGVASDILRRTRYFGSNPISAVEHFLGQWTLGLLVATLCVTPARQLLGWNWLGRQRRTLGLFAFAYVTLHWLAYALLDVQLDGALLLEDLTDRPYIMVGMGGLSLLLPLALTSTQGWIRRLGGRRWSQLHRLVYPAAVLGVVHYWMAVKADIQGPLLFALAFATLFIHRLWRWRRRPA